MSCAARHSHLHETAEFLWIFMVMWIWERTHATGISVNLRAVEPDTVNLTAGDCAAAIYRPSWLMLASGTQAYKGSKTEDFRKIAGS